jgi:hypothetical protein
MAGAVIEVKYFNTFVLKKTVKNTSETIVWNGSFGIPADQGGYPAMTASTQTTVDESNWILEESRIRGGYNNTNVDYGVRAYLVEEEPNSTIRFNSLIYSGIFNSRTGINNTNVFSTADDITKSADPANASIQKLYAEDTNLVIFQELKVSRALIDKDAIYSAEGGGTVTSSNLVIGVIQPYVGEYGISKDPGSFAVYGYRKYFSDKNNNVILRLSRDGLEEISRYGMVDYFRDELNEIDNSSIIEGKIVGGYDIHNDQYVISTQSSDGVSYNTVSFDESVKGWTSFYDYKPSQMFSLRNKFYTTGKQNQYVGFPTYAWTTQDHDNLYQHYSDKVNRSFFYERNYPSTVTFIFNPNPSTSKNFKTISYEGMSGWQLNTLVSDDTGTNYDSTLTKWNNSNDATNSALSYLLGEYVINPANGQPVTRANYNAVFGTTQPGLPRFHAGFDRKENRYVTNLINSSVATEGEILFGRDMSGIKGYYITGVFSTDGDYSTNISYNNNTATDPGGEKQLFAVGSDYIRNNGY